MGGPTQTTVGYMNGLTSGRLGDICNLAVGTRSPGVIHERRSQARGQVVRFNGGELIMLTGELRHWHNGVEPICSRLLKGGFRKLLSQKIGTGRDKGDTKITSGIRISVVGMRLGRNIKLVGQGLRTAGLHDTLIVRRDGELAAAQQLESATGLCI